MKKCKASRKTFYYNHDTEKNDTENWNVGPSLIRARYDHAVGIVIDEATKEEIVIVTGGTSLLGSTEILLDGSWSEGESKSYVPWNFFGFTLPFGGKRYGYHSCPSLTVVCD